MKRYKVTLWPDPHLQKPESKSFGRQGSFPWSKGDSAEKNAFRPKEWSYHSYGDIYHEL